MASRVSRICAASRRPSLVSGLSIGASQWVSLFSSMKNFRKTIIRKAPPKAAIS